MRFDEYKYSVQMDMLEYIEENLQSFRDTSIDDMRMVVTGDDNGSYYCDVYKARKAVSPAMWEIGDELESAYGRIAFAEAAKGAEYMDCLIRDYAFMQLYNEIDDMIENVIDDQSFNVE